MYQRVATRVAARAVRARVPAVSAAWQAPQGCSSSAWHTTPRYMRGVRGFAGSERGADGASAITQRATSAVAASSARWTVSGCGSVVAAGIVGVAATTSRAMCTGEKGSEKEGSSDDAAAAGEEAAAEEAAEEEEVPFVTTKSGLQYRDDKVGDGDEAANGMVVKVHYSGWLTDGTQFDSSYPRGSPIEFQLGAGRVIAGWEEGIVGMRVGGKRTLVIPSQLGYGPNAMGPIPANSTLIFVTELVVVGEDPGMFGWKNWMK